MQGRIKSAPPFPKEVRTDLLKRGDVILIGATQGVVDCVEPIKGSVSCWITFIGGWRAMKFRSSPQTVIGVDEHFVLPSDDESQPLAAQPEDEPEQDQTPIRAVVTLSDSRKLFMFESMEAVLSFIREQLEAGKTCCVSVE